MEDLLQSQIQESCRLALPEGLKELCSDISREVLRAQPKDILSFITDYLSCLLVTRENLTVAARINKGCTCSAQGTSFPDELRTLGVREHDIEVFIEVVDKWFEKAKSGDPVKESSLLLELMGKTSLTKDQLPLVVEKIRDAYLQMQLKDPIHDESSSEEELNEVDLAAKHTMRLYRSTGPSDQDYNRAAVRIQAAYRAYGVRREKARYAENAWAYAPGVEGRANAMERNLTNADGSRGSSRCSGATQATTDIVEGYRSHHRAVTTVSSASLAGSFMSLPKHKPYKANEAYQEATEDEDVQLVEKESSFYDYTKDPEFNEQAKEYRKEGKLKIKDIHSDAGSVEENLDSQNRQSTGSLYYEDDDDESVDDVFENPYVDEYASEYEGEVPEELVGEQGQLDGNN